MISRGKTPRAPITFGDVEVAAGERKSIYLDVARLYTHTSLDMVVEVIHSKRDGPVLLVSAAIHGDEINGVEICRQLLKHKALKRIRGTLVIVPVVNIFGFIHRSRYLPDRRDMNRSFPGSAKGSVGGRFAYQFRTQILSQCTHVIDLHTGAVHRSNLPQIRANMDNPVAAQMSLSFGAPVVIDSKTRDGSLRECADKQGVPVILYEAGEALRFDAASIKGGVRGILNVMRNLEMLPASPASKKAFQPVIARASYWLRAEIDGICMFMAKLGQRVAVGDVLALISSPFSTDEYPVISRTAGIIIGRNNIPLVNEGDALFHIARFATVVKAEKSIETFHSEIEEDY
ncbi:succinylglutamate desuccinylase/aspartoacylase family protein [Photobacterium atrarenae]|uniref:Succinylglutamate desuccinylase/aspartoacylase family protein n=1 Tax=Photobacterium atrarenae TaxID=865757 RepID=A0ABY5GMG5_9GAMM|nr:succinylglutamate desuccinylase/aspartoacylase family protein [Photobacterium atrarenae]UTV30299.1 succinylglutamate desuccinylase/aspartoacylase family protein [Photobacterium atrarenae]